MSELFDEPKYDYLPVRWTVPGLPDDRREYRSEISADWWDGQTAEERDRLFSDQRAQLAESVARTMGVRVDPSEITYKVYDHRKSAGPVRPDEEQTP
jgi:hypothetical protein